MAKKTIGYIELEWSCPNCGNKNAGMKKSCVSCGAPQPENAQFEVGQKQDLISDTQKLTGAAKGADVHCPFCNTRNTSDAQNCVQCGGDLKEGIRRESGRVLSGGAPAISTTPLNCPACGTLMQPGTNTCSACGAALVKADIPTGGSAETPGAKPITAGGIKPWMLLPIIAILATICVVFGFLFFRTTALMGVVQNKQWQRTISIEGQVEVTREDWRDQLPSETKVLSCKQTFRTRQENPAAGAKEVCTTELVDQGNGAAKIVESCFYEIYADLCKYQALEWQTVDQAVAEGTDLQPFWPQVNPAKDLREGARTETYSVFFETKDGVKEFTTSDAGLFAQLQPGTDWTLSVNTLGTIVDVSP